MLNPIIDRMNERRSKEKYIADRKEAEEIWDLQKEAIKEIQHTPWYAAIKEYFSLEMSASLDRLESMKGSDPHAMENLRITKKFLSFLDSRT